MYAQIAHHGVRMHCRTCGFELIPPGQSTTTQIVSGTGELYEFSDGEAMRLADETFAMRCQCGEEVTFRIDGVRRSFELQRSAPTVIAPAFIFGGMEISW